MAERHAGGPAAATEAWASRAGLVRSQARIVDAYTGIAIAYCLVSGWLFLGPAQVPVEGWIHLGAALVIALNYAALHFTKDLRAAAHVILAMGTLVVGSLFATGGWAGSGMLWTFAYLPYAFFLASTFVAALWVCILVAVDLGFFAAHLTGAYPLVYTGPELAVFWASLGIFLLCMFLFKDASIRSERGLEAQSAALGAANQELDSIRTALDRAQAIAHVGSWTWEPAQGRTTFSPEMARLYGTADGVVPTSLEEYLLFLHPDDRAAMRLAVQDVIAHGTALDIEVRVLRRDGMQFRHHVRGVGERGADGRVWRLAGTAQDVTHLREAEEQRHRALQQQQELESLKELARLKTQFMNTAAHELNTPLTPIHMELHLLKSDSVASSPEKRRHSVEVLERNIQRLQSLVGDLLQGARMQSGRLDLRPRTVAVQQVLEDAYQAHANLAQAKGIALEVEAAIGTATLDPARIAQVLDNLVGNALKFTPAGGRVTLRCVKVPSSGRLRFEVVDSGSGLSAQAIGRLFQPFSQVHDPMERTEAGSGLGLYIARGIVEAHGGAIGVTSPGPDQGCTFWFEVPPNALADPAPAVPALLDLAPTATD